MIKAPAVKAIKKKVERDIYGAGSIGVFTELDREVENIPLSRHLFDI